jgi:SAM-dependent methyltransferase
MKVLVARSYREAYAYRATYFANPSMMAGRDARSTLFKCRNIVARLPVRAGSTVLDVGCGDGTLLGLLRGKVARRCGIDPCPAAVRKLARRFEGERDVEIELGTSDRIPYPDDAFDVVVVNAVLLHLSSERELVRSLAELVRVCAHGGVAYVGEMPFRPESGWRRYWTLLRHVGPRTALRFVGESYLGPLVRGEPLLIEPGGRTLWVPARRMLALCEAAGTAARYWRHQEIRRPSTTRNDYLLRVAKGAGVGRDAGHGGHSHRSQGSRTR